MENEGVQGGHYDAQIPDWTRGVDTFGQIGNVGEEQVGSQGEAELSYGYVGL